MVKKLSKEEIVSVEAVVYLNVWILQANDNDLYPNNVVSYYIKASDYSHYFTITDEPLEGGGGGASLNLIRKFQFKINIHLTSLI